MAAYLRREIADIVADTAFKGNWDYISDVANVEIDGQVDSLTRVNDTSVEYYGFVSRDGTALRVRGDKFTFLIETKDAEEYCILDMAHSAKAPIIIRGQLYRRDDGTLELGVHGLKFGGIESYGFQQYLKQGVIREKARELAAR